MKIIRLDNRWYLVLAIILWTAGIFFIPKQNTEPLISCGMAEQDEFTWTDSEGEEHEGQTLIKIEGIGCVLTYRNIYGSVILLFIPFLVIGRLLFGEKQNELKSIIFGNCVIGLALIALSSNAHVIPTVLYWLGIVNAGMYNDCRKPSGADKRTEKQMKIPNGEYFMWEDTGKELTRELINFKFRTHKVLPIAVRDRVFAELDSAVETALTDALNFEQFEEYNKMNETYKEYAND